MVPPVHIESITTDSSDTGDDLLLAQMLQLEFDREHDLLVSAQEKHHNKNSKSMLLLLFNHQSLHYTVITVAISFDKYRSVHPALCEDDEYNDDDIDSGDDEEIPQHSPTNSHSTTGSSSKKRRAKRSNETTPTKHDPYVCGRRNVRNMEKVVSDDSKGCCNQCYYCSSWKHLVTLLISRMTTPCPIVFIIV